MPSKSEITTSFIIKTVAPVFNKKGYSGTSMQDITNATGLTKGAVYGNFENKNELAVKAFVYNIKLVMARIETVINQEKSSTDKLYAISKFYRNYYQFTYDFGGCPLLNVGIDANHQNQPLLEKVKKAIYNIQNSISHIISSGINNGEFSKKIDPQVYARRIFALIEGAIFMSMATQTEAYMVDMSDMLNNMIEKEILT